MNTTAVEYEYDAILDSPLGKIGVRLCRRVITRLDYLGDAVALKSDTTPAGRQVATQLAHYFDNPQHHFTLPVEPQGTDFQRRVWLALTDIPSGATRTYGGLAAALGSGARAVGNACRNNPVSIIIPCHRIVSVSGIGGYSGKTAGREINRKQWLLRHEGLAGPALKPGKNAPSTGYHPHL